MYDEKSIRANWPGLCHAQLIKVTLVALTFYTQNWYKVISIPSSMSQKKKKGYFTTIVWGTLAWKDPYYINLLSQYLVL